MPVPNDAPSLKRPVGFFYYSIHYYSIMQPLLKPTDIAVAAYDKFLSLQIETDASSVSKAANLIQHGRPVAFFSRTSTNPKNYSLL